MKKLTSIDFKDWFIKKMSAQLLSASVNSSYEYEVIAETEKAIQIEISNPEKALSMPFKQWIPKSAIEKM